MRHVCVYAEKCTVSQNLLFLDIWSVKFWKLTIVYLCIFSMFTSEPSQTVPVQKRHRNVSQFSCGERPVQQHHQGHLQKAQACLDSRDGARVSYFFFQVLVKFAKWLNWVARDMTGWIIPVTGWKLSIANAALNFIRSPVENNSVICTGDRMKLSTFYTI